MARRRFLRNGLTALATLLVLLLLPLSLYGVFGCSKPMSEESELPPVPEEEYVPGQIIVKFKPGTSVEAENKLNKSLGSKTIYTSPSGGFKILQIAEGKTVTKMVAIYSQQPIVEYAEPNFIEHTLPETKS